MKRNERLESQVRLEHILKSISDIERYVYNKTSEIFCEDSLLNNAVLFQFSIVGEAIIHVEREILNQYAYPWHKVRSFRNLIAHEYFNIKLNAVWKIIEDDLPELKKTVQTILENEFHNP